MTGRTRDQLIEAIVQDDGDVSDAIAALKLLTESRHARADFEHTCESSWCMKDGLDPGYCLGEVGVTPATADTRTFVTTGDELRVRYADVTISGTWTPAQSVPVHVALSIGGRPDQMLKLTAAEARRLAGHLVAGALKVEDERAES